MIFRILEVVNNCKNKYFLTKLTLLRLPFQTLQCMTMVVRKLPLVRTYLLGLYITNCSRNYYKSCLIYKT